MGFCRRCGDIVVGVRCKCGGMAVAPVVPWNQADPDEKSQDRWSKTYVQRPKSISPTKSVCTPGSGSPSTSSPAKRFPRPMSSEAASSSSFNSKKAAYQPPTTSIHKAVSPLQSPPTLPSGPDIFPSIDPTDTTLSKVYGSVLQRPETLETHSCAICSSPFPPDATIYPDPSAPTTSRYLCRPCFENNGGSKGNCPTCSRPVLTLKSEGGFIHASGSYWHKHCFNCAECHRNIGDAPMVDFFGRPSCPECFDNCLRRNPTTPKKASSTINSPDVDRPRGVSVTGATTDIERTKEASPAVVQELQQRLGIVKHREGSFALEDLTQRLSMMGRDSGSRTSLLGRHDEKGSNIDRRPLLEETRARADCSTRAEASSDNRNHSSPSPVSRNSAHLRPQATGSPAPTPEAIEQMKQRFIKASSPSPHSKTPSREFPSLRDTPPLRFSRSSTSLRSSPRIFVPQASDEPISPNSPTLPPTPDLMSDFSDSITQYSESPPRNDGGDVDLDDVFNAKSGINRRPMEEFSETGTTVTAEGVGQLDSPPRSSFHSSRVSSSTPPNMRPSLQPTQPTDGVLPGSCATCKRDLFSIRAGGRFITVPPSATDASPLTYHVHCFKCVICDGLFREAASGQAVFVRAHGGACHVECAPVERFTIETTPKFGFLGASRPPSTPPLRAPSKPSPRSSYKTSSRLDRPSTSQPITVARRFGSTTICPGCKKSVSPMEPGVVPGPQGTRWHASCLVCGGKKESSGGWRIWKGKEEKTKGEAGCGKKLDSAARTAADGSVWCRECLLLLGIGGSPQRGQVAPPDSSSELPPQFSGTTTLARQFTGLGGNSEAGLLRQLTGGGLNPTRSISPTKQVGGPGRLRPRPKSVIGMRNAKGVDEGRGMSLVRQLTGASSG